MDPEQQQPQAPSGTDNPILNGLRTFSRNGSPIGNMIGLGLALTGQSQGPYASATSTPEDAAVSQGMDMLGAEMARNGGDPAKAMVTMTQDKRFQRLMAVPGTFKRITDTFRSSLTNPNPESISAAPGTSVYQNGRSVPLQGQPGYTPPLPQQTNVPEGSANRTTQVTPGQPGSQVTGTMRQPTGATQTFNDMVEKYAKGWDSNVLSQIAMSTVAVGDPAKKLATLQGMAQQGLLSPEMVQQLANGAQVIQDKDVPGRFYWVNPTGKQIQGPDGQTHYVPDIQMFQLGGFGPNGPSLNPSYTTGNESPTESFGSSPDVQKGQAPGPQGNAAPGGGSPGVPLAGLTPPSLHPDAAGIAAKYGVPQQAVKSNGHLDVGAAYGQPAQMILGAGLPALWSNDVIHIKQWLDPGKPTQMEESIRQAEVFSSNLKYMSDRVATASKGGRLTGPLESLREMGTEHEKWNDPGYAIDQLGALRNQLDAIAKSNANEQRIVLSNGVKSEADSSRMSEMREENNRIGQLLDFLPSAKALRSMKQAFDDGMIDTPTIGTSARTTVEAGKAVLGHAAKAAFPGKVDDWNGDIPGTIQQINSKTKLSELLPLANNYNQLDPRLQKALDAQALRLQGAPMRGTVKGGGSQKIPTTPKRTEVPLSANPVPFLGGGQSTQPGNPFGGLQ